MGLLPYAKKSSKRAFNKYIFRRYFYGGLLRTPDRVLNGRNSSFEPLILLDLQNTFEEEAGKSSTLNELEVITMTGHLEILDDPSF